MMTRAHRTLPSSHLLRAAALLATLSAAGAAVATPLPAYPTTDPGPSSVAWFTDRYAPSSFANAGTLFGRNDVLALAISSADSAANRPPAFSSAFYNTQGRKIDVGLAPPVSWIASLYVPSSWATGNPGDAALSRRSDLWATLKDGGGNPTFYPIVGFTNADATTGFGGTPRFRVFDGTGAWNDLAQPIVYDGWNDVCVTYTGTTLEYRIGDTLVFTDTHPDIALGTEIGDAMLQAYNWGSDYTANWSWVAAGQATCSELRAAFVPRVRVAPAPVPAGPFGAIGAALAVALAAMRRRRR